MVQFSNIIIKQVAARFLNTTRYIQKIIGKLGSF